MFRLQAHAGCYQHLPAVCSFGILREIMLPPSCITVPDMGVAMEHIYRFQKKAETTIPGLLRVIAVAKLYKRANITFHGRPSLSNEELRNSFN